MEYEYRTNGTCSGKILFSLEDGILGSVRFIGGCSGNTQGLARLVEGMRAEEVVSRLKGIRCGMKPTSCPDQLARAVEKALQG